MNFPTSVIITFCDALPIWEPALTARSFKPFTADELAKILSLAGERKYSTNVRLAGRCCFP
jgi:hypothetical protein